MSRSTKGNLSAIRSAIPGTFCGCVYAVIVRPGQTPIATFQYGDQAHKWAREEYGVWDGWAFRMRDGVEVMAIEVGEE